MVNWLSIVTSEYVQFVLILVSGLFLTYLVSKLFSGYLKKLVEATESDTDDKLVDAIKDPLCNLLLVMSFYFALRKLSVLYSVHLWLDKVFFVIFIAVMAILSSRIFSILVDKWLEVHKRFKKTPQLLNKIFAVTIYLVALLMILGYFDVEVTPLIATLGIGGLAVGLALQKTLSDFFAGIHIISERQINVGDHIELKGEKIKGFVEDIGWRSTKIKTLTNNVIIMPNSRLADSTITNNRLPKNEMTIKIDCGVAYDSDLKKVEKIAVDVAKKIQKKVQGAKQEFEPWIRFHNFGESNIEFKTFLRVETFVDQYLVKHEFIKELKSRFDKEHIEISWPVRKIYSGDKPKYQTKTKSKLKSKPKSRTKRVSRK